MKCKCGKEDLYGVKEGNYLSVGMTSHGHGHCETAGFVAGAVNFVKPHHVEKHPLNVHVNKWDNTTFKDSYEFPSYADIFSPRTTSKDHKEFIHGAKYTEEDIKMARNRARDEGYNKGYETGFNDGQSTKRYLDADYNATKAHVEKSEEYWADGIDPDEP